MRLIDRLPLILDSKLHIGVLTGAGISAESGVPIFRGKGSMWEDNKTRELARKAGPPWNTKGTWEYYEWRRGLVSRCEPNAAHLTLVAATLNAAINASTRADLFLVIGTSAVVSPARGLPLIALKKGATVIEINRDPTPLTPLVTLSVRGKAAEILPQLWKELLSK